MGVAVEADEGGLGGEVGLGLGGLVYVVELCRLVQGGMGKSNRIEIHGDGEIPEPSEFVFADLLLGDLKRFADGHIPILFQDLVGQEKHGLVVTKNGDRAEVHDPLHAVTRFGPVPHDVPKAEHAAHREARHVGKDGLEGVDVAMDVTEDGEEVVLGGLGGLGGAGVLCGFGGFGHGGVGLLGCWTVGG